MIWQNMTKEEKDSVIDYYNNVKKQIRSLSCTKANYEKKHKYTQQQLEDYNNKIKELQSLYDNISIEYTCTICNKVFKLDLNRFKKLIKDSNCPLFCSNKCSVVYAHSFMNNKTLEEKQVIHNKIKDTLQNKMKDKEQLQKCQLIGSQNFKNYWNKYTEEQRSQINKKSYEKCKQTKLEKYGNENYNNIDKIKQTYKQRYTHLNPPNNYKHLVKETLNIIRNRDLFKQHILNIPLEHRCIATIAKSLGIAETTCNNIIIKFNLYQDKDVKIHRNISKPQMEVEDFIKSIYDGEIITNTKKVITPYELDIFIPDKQVAIEYNGNYFHTADKVDKNYHYNKSKICEEKGIRLIHVFEYEWYNGRQRPILQNIISNALGVNCNKIFARNLDIEVRESKTMKDFFNTNNIQGFRPGKFSICLVDKNTREVYMAYMMGSAFFGKGKYEWEVIRGATKLGCTVVGGASRIWKYFINTYKPDNCVYYIDYNYFNGNSMKNLDNMKFIKTQMGYKNYFIQTNEVKNRDPMHNKEIKQLYKQGLAYPIYNAGTKVYLWSKE